MKQVDLIASFHEANAFHAVYKDLGRKLQDKLIELLIALNNINGEQNWVYVGHEMGIPHTATDFADTDENGIAKTKVFEYISCQKGLHKLAIQFGNGSESTAFAIDDLAYLMEDVLNEIQYLVEEDGLLKEE